jgi:hypothetical protein
VTAQGLVGAEGSGHLGQVGAARRAGEQDPDDLGSFADGALVRSRILLVDLLVGCEPEVVGQLPDLLEPARVRAGLGAGRLVAVGEGPGHGPHRLGVEAAEPGVGRVDDRLEELREEVAVDLAEVRPLAQVLARVVDAHPFDVQRAQRQPGLGGQDRREVGVVLAGPRADRVEDLLAGQGGDVIGADVVELDHVHQRARGAALR